jgi:hypothetical protein
VKRAGVVEPRGRRPRWQPSSPPKVDAKVLNDVWSMDYKGWFRVGDGTRCDPLTATQGSVPRVRDAAIHVGAEVYELAEHSYGRTSRRAAFVRTAV